MIVRLLVKGDIDGNKIDLRTFFKPIKYRLLYRSQYEFPITHKNIALSNIILNVEINANEKLKSSDVSKFLGKIISFIQFDGTFVSQNTTFNVITLFNSALNPTIEITDPWVKGEER